MQEAPFQTGTSSQAAEAQRQPSEPNTGCPWLGYRDLTLLLLIAAVFASLWAFIALADAMQKGATEAFDRGLLMALRNKNDITDPLGPGWVEEMGRDFTALGGIPVLTLVSLSILAYLFVYGSRRIAVFFLAATVGALILSNVLKLALDRPRPDLVPHGAMVYTSSFPSAHAMQSAATYLTLGALLARVQTRRKIKVLVAVTAVLITVLVGVSRVYLGVHWPTDVLAGWTAGAAWALLCWLIARWLQLRGQPQRKVVNEDEPAVGAQSS